MDPRRVERLVAGAHSSPRAGIFVLSRFIGNSYLSLSGAGRPCVVFVLRDAPRADHRVMKAIETTVHPTALISTRGRVKRAAIAVVELADPARLKLFCLLLSDFAEALSRQADSFHTASQVADKIDFWREAFQGVRPLTPNEEIGLWGELELLERIGLTDFAIESWHGPEASKFDYAGNRVSLEVKTSVRPHIHEFGLEQLIAPGTSALYVASICVREDFATGTSVSEKADLIAGRLKAPGAFRRKLGMLGLDPGAVQVRRFSVDSLLVVEGAEVPTVRDADPEVSQVRFTSDISGVKPLPARSVARVLRALGSRRMPGRRRMSIRAAPQLATRADRRARRRI